MEVMQGLYFMIFLIIVLRAGLSSFVSLAFVEMEKQGMSSLIVSAFFFWVANLSNLAGMEIVDLVVVDLSLFLLTLTAGICVYVVNRYEYMECSRSIWCASTLFTIIQFISEKSILDQMPSLWNILISTLLYWLSRKVSAPVFVKILYVMELHHEQLVSLWAELLRLIFQYWGKLEDLLGYSVHTQSLRVELQYFKVNEHIVQQNSDVWALVAVKTTAINHFFTLFAAIED